MYMYIYSQRITSCFVADKPLLVSSELMRRLATAEKVADYKLLRRLMLMYKHNGITSYATYIFILLVLYKYFCE